MLHLEHSGAWNFKKTFCDRVKAGLSGSHSKQKNCAADSALKVQSVLSHAWQLFGPTTHWWWLWVYKYRLCQQLPIFREKKTHNFIMIIWFLDNWIRCTIYSKIWNLIIITERCACHRIHLQNHYIFWELDILETKSTSECALEYTISKYSPDHTHCSKFS